jgi:hypothetical protein
MHGRLNVPLPAVQKPLVALQQVAASLPAVTEDADLTHAELWTAIADLTARIEALEARPSA